jgi:hypothetical protein
MDSSEYNIVPSDSIKVGQFFDHVSDYQLKKDFAVWSYSSLCFMKDACSAHRVLP